MRDGGDVMAQGRMIQRRISTSKKLAQLVSEVDRLDGNGAYAALLYTWCLAHLDVDGRMEGDPCVVRGNVVPRIPHYTESNVRDYLRTMHNVGLVYYYEAEGDWWLEFCNFNENQPGLRKEREGKSRITPAPQNATKNALRSNAGVLPEYSGVTPAEDNRSLREENRREENVNPARARVDESSPQKPERSRIGLISDAWISAGLPPNGNAHELGVFADGIDTARRAAQSVGQDIPDDLALCRAFKTILDGWRKEGKTPKYQPTKMLDSLGLAIEIARNGATARAKNSAKGDDGDRAIERLANARANAAPLPADWRKQVFGDGANDDEAA